MSDARDLQIITDPMPVFPCVTCGAKLDLAGREPFTPVRCPACRSEMQVPARMGGFLLVELLGAGGMGSAYRARDEALNRDVAIKIMRKSFGDDPKFVETFRREAQSAARLNHPNVVQIYSFGEFKGQPFIVMELVTGGSLDRQMTGGEPLDPPLVMRIGLEIASALQSGYQVQLIHGDIKPENILLDEKGAGKLVDFGIAQLAGCQSQEVWGTPYYIAPEKVRRQRADCRADIYSLGGTLYHALVGKPPFDGADATAVVKARFLGPAQPLSELRADLDPEIETIIDRMLQLEPSMRYPTYESLLGDLRHFLDRAGPGFLTGKKMVLKKKGQSSTATNIPVTGKMAAVVAPTTASSGGASPAKSTPKFVIKKAGVSLSLGPTKGGGTGAGAAKATAAGVAPAKTGVPVGVVVLLVVFCLLLTTGIGAGIWFLAKRNAVGPVGGAVPPPPVAGATGSKELDGAKQQLQGHLALAHTVRTNLQAWAASAERLCSAANAAVTNVLGAEQYEIMIPLRPPSPASGKPVSATTGTSVGTNGLSATLERGTNLVGTAVPAGTNASTVVTSPAVDPVQESSIKNPVIVNVRNMYRGMYRLDELAGESAGLQDALDAAVAGVSATASVESLSVQALAFEGQLQPYTATGSKTEEARRKLANLRQELLVVSNLVQVIRKGLLLEQQRIALENDIAKSNQMIQAIETARKLKIADEIAVVTSREGEIKELLRKHKYAEARRKLGTVEVLLSEEESRKAFELATQRINRLEELQEFFMTRLPGYQDPAGWKIESVDKHGLAVRNRGVVKDVTWPEVGDVRMVTFMRYLLLSEEGARNLKLREQVRALINAALYCRTFILPNKHVQELVEKMVEKAIQLLPDSKPEIELLLPGVAKADGEKLAENKP